MSKAARFPSPLPPPTISVPPRRPPPKNTKPAAAPAASKEHEQIRQLADAGKLPEALDACQKYLSESGPCPHAYYLMRLVRDAAGDADAVDCYRSDVNRDPNHSAPW